MRFFKNRGSESGPASRQGGQILLIVVLAAVVSLTVGLSAVSRTITNTRVTTEEANSQKALSAAEAGIEELVGAPSVSGIPKRDLSNNSSFTANSKQVSEAEFLLNGGSQVLKDDGGDVWLSVHPNFDPPPTGLWTGTMTIYWSNNDSCTPTGSQVAHSAIEVAVISGPDKNNPSMNRFAFDPCSARITGNGFAAASTGTFTVKGKTFQNSATVSISNGFIARIVPIYANTTVAVVGTSTSGAPNPFPSQGYEIESTGTAGTTKRAVRVFQGWPRVPIEYFPYNLFLP